MPKSRDYEVGKGRPPKTHQFKPGRSGNPSGRPKGSGGVASVLARALAEKVTVTENGRRREISKLDAAVKQLANKAASGDPVAAKMVLGMLSAAEDRAPVDQSADVDAAARKARDQEVMGWLAQTLHRKKETG